MELDFNGQEILKGLVNYFPFGLSKGKLFYFIILLMFLMNKKSLFHGKLLKLMLYILVI